MQEQEYTSTEKELRNTLIKFIRHAINKQTKTVNYDNIADMLLNKNVEKDGAGFKLPTEKELESWEKQHNGALFQSVVRMHLWLCGRFSPRRSAGPRSEPFRSRTGCSSPDPA